MPTATTKQKYIELADYLRERILNGELQVGQRLPSYAELYEEHGVSTATVQRACDLLDQERLIERRHRSGVFVAAPRRNLTGTIGVIGSAGFEEQEVPFYARLMGAMHQALKARGRHVLYMGCADEWNPRHPAQVDGFLICGEQQTSPILRKVPASIPRISVLTPMEGATSVGIDNYRASQMAMRHLLEFGHRRIACLMEDDAWEARLRIAAYNDSLRDVGVQVDSRWVRAVEDSKKAGMSYLEWARKHTREWLDSDWNELGCTAILVQNDLAAIGVMQVLQEANIRVPQDISVMGFDGTELCNLTSPTLSAVGMPLAQIGAKAVELLIRQIEGEEPTEETILMPLALCRGGSVGYAPQSD